MEVITECDVSILELSKEELQEKYNKLSKTYKKALDDKNQKLYDLQRELTRISSLEQEYIQEIEILQSSDKGEVKKLEAKISDLQKKLLEVKVENREAVLELEQTVLKKDEEIRELKEHLASSGKCEENSASNGFQDEKLREENSAQKEEIECLLEKLKENEVNCTKLAQQVEKITQQKEEEYNNLQEILNAKKEELSEVKTLLETMQEENILMRNEMEMMKNKPSDTDARGNSLFAEVNDRRVQLQRNMDKMKSHYLEMRNQNATLLKQVAALKLENTCLTQQWKEDAIQREVDDDALIQSLKDRVETLEELNNRYESFLEQRAELNMPDELKCVELMLKSKEELLEEAWKKQKEQSKKLVSISRELYNSNKELREWKSKSFHLKSKLAELETNEKDVKTEKEVVTVCAKCKEERSEKKIRFCRDQQKQKQPQQQPTTKYVEIDFRKFLLGDDSKKSNKEDEKENNLNNVNKVTDDNNLNNVNKVTGDNNLSEKGKMEEVAVVQDACRKKVPDERKKCVQFTEDTLDINKENSRKPTRRGNILSCPVVFVPSAPEKE